MSLKLQKKNARNFDLETLFIPELSSPQCFFKSKIFLTRFFKPCEHDHLFIPNFFKNLKKILTLKLSKSF